MNTVEILAEMIAGLNSSDLYDLANELVTNHNLSAQMLKADLDYVEPEVEFDF